MTNNCNRLYSQPTGDRIARALSLLVPLMLSFAAYTAASCERCYDTGTIITVDSVYSLRAAAVLRMQELNGRLADIATAGNTGTFATLIAAYQVVPLGDGRWMVARDTGNFCSCDKGRELADANAKQREAGREAKGRANEGSAEDGAATYKQRVRERQDEVNDNWAKLEAHKNDYARNLKAQRDAAWAKSLDPKYGPSRDSRADNASGANTSSTPSSKLSEPKKNSMTIVILKNGTRLAVSVLVESDDVYIVKDDQGMRSIKKIDVKEILK